MTAPSAAAATKLGRRVLTIGMRGRDVKVLQHDLTKVGIKTKANGRFNRVTRSHVERFQREDHLSVDGVVGRHTVRALKHAVKAHEQATKATDSGGSSTGGSGTGTTGSGGDSGTGTSGSSSTSSSSATSTSCTLKPTGDGQVGLMAAPPPCPKPQKLHVNARGLVVIPANVPGPIKRLLTAANHIAHTLYVYGGGHNGWGKQRGYDCSGSTSYVLHAAGLMVKRQGDKWDEPFDSSQFENYGLKGKSPRGWLTLYTNPSHVYLKVSNLYFDTAAQGGRRHGSRWSTSRLGPHHGWHVRHPKGW